MALFLALGPARAEYEFSADQLTIDHGRQRAELTGKVTIESETETILADTAEISYVGDPAEITFVFLTGNVRLKRDDRAATGDVAHYSPMADTALLRGNVHVRDGPSELWGDVVELDGTTGEVHARGNVRGTFHPEVGIDPDDG